MEFEEHKDVNEIICTPNKDMFNCKLYKVEEDRERSLIAEVNDLTLIQSNTEKTILSNHPESPINLYIKDKLECKISEFPDIKLLDCRHY